MKAPVYKRMSDGPSKSIIHKCQQAHTSCEEIAESHRRVRARIAILPECEVHLQRIIQYRSQPPFPIKVGRAIEACRTMRTGQTERVPSHQFNACHDVLQKRPLKQNFEHNRGGRWRVRWDIGDVRQGEDIANSRLVNAWLGTSEREVVGGVGLVW